MEYLAVYRREDDPQYDGLPIALFRDGALMGDWHRTSGGVVGRNPVLRAVDLEADDFYSEEVAAMFERPKSAADTEMLAYEQLKAEAKARLTREGMAAAAEMAARRELAEEGYPVDVLNPMPGPTGPIDSLPPADVPTGFGIPATGIHEDSGGVVTTEDEAKAAEADAAEARKAGNEVMQQKADEASGDATGSASGSVTPSDTTIPAPTPPAAPRGRSGASSTTTETDKAPPESTPATEPPTEDA